MQNGTERFYNKLNWLIDVMLNGCSGELDVPQTAVRMVRLEQGISTQR